MSKEEKLKNIAYRLFDFRLNNADVCDMICLLQSSYLWTFRSLLALCPDLRSAFAVCNCMLNKVKTSSAKWFIFLTMEEKVEAHRRCQNSGFDLTSKRNKIKDWQWNSGVWQQLIELLTWCCLLNNYTLRPSVCVSEIYAVPTTYSALLDHKPSLLSRFKSSAAPDGQLWSFCGFASDARAN